MPKKSSRRNRQALVPNNEGDLAMSVASSRRLGASVGMPDRLQVDLSYQVNARVNPGAVAYSDTIFDLNNLYDPERTGTGHQPREFDQLAALYLYYRCYSAKVEVEIRQRASHGIRAVIVASTTGSAWTTSDNPAEMRRAWVSPVTGSSQPAIKFTRTYSNAAILGMSPAQYAASEDTDAVTSAAPDLPTLLHMYVEQLDGATAVDFEYSMKITFRTVFHGKRQVSTSLTVGPPLPAARGPSASAPGAGVTSDPPGSRGPQWQLVPGRK